MSKDWNPLDHLAEAKRLASLGLTEKQIATKFNIHYDVLRYHRTHCPRLERAIQEGLNNTIMLLTEQLVALGTSGDFKAIKFFLEKKGGWGDNIMADGPPKPSYNNFNLIPTPLPAKVETDVDD